MKSATEVAAAINDLARQVASVPGPPPDTILFTDPMAWGELRAQLSLSNRQWDRLTTEERESAAAAEVVVNGLEL